MNIFEQRQLWEIERNNAANENRIPARFIGRQPNLINNNLMREILFTKHISNKRVKPRCCSRK
jgi:hypothetical protein